MSLMCLSMALSAQVTISGVVTFGPLNGDQSVLPSYDVTINAPGDVFIETVTTNDEGVYTFTTADALPGEIWTVNALDICQLRVVTTEVEIIDGINNFAVDLNLCSEVNPPFPVDTCFVSFDHLTFPDEPLSFFFFSAYNNLASNISLLWDFGDGNTSTEEAPFHTYGQPGDYDVTLTLTADDCSATTTGTVSIFDPTNCNCTDSTYSVCVYNDFGQVITFDNACLAECAGYSPSQYFDCNSDCFCPTFYAPVCAVTDAGDTLNFTNHCFAECEGYTDWFDCSPEPTGCDCDGEPFERVCVNIGGIILPFVNACEALCAGFTEDMFVDCLDDCGCGNDYSPVCTIDNVTGDTITYDNYCLAACDGVDFDDLVVCGDDPSGCGCDGDYNPVCVVGTMGDTITYTNPCLAECDGYGVDQHFDCDVNACDLPDIAVCYFDSLIGFEYQFRNYCEALDFGIALELLYPCSNEPDCEASFDYYASPSDSLGVQFVNLSSTSDSLVSIMWVFGDGDTSYVEDPMHIYQNAGLYNVLLEVTDASGCTASVVLDVYVGFDGPPVFDDCLSFFFFEQPDSNDLLTFQFINFSGFGAAVTSFWDFGDGNTSTDQNPIHTYAEEGTYRVSLTVTTFNGCESTIEIAVFAGENIWYGDLECRAWFMPIIENNNTVSFINLSSYDAVSFAWDFGDGNVSTEREVTHTYDAAGVYEVVLTIVSASGCENTYSATLDLNTGDFTSNPQYQLLSSTSSIVEPVISGLVAAPNPTNGMVRLSWESPAVSDFAYRLMDFNGRTVLSGKGQTTSSANNISLDLSQFASGMYFLQVSSSNSRETIKIIKTE